ncbi:MAG: hypothetical protein HY901_33475, partial [Deltaproteobacteria bacterium]|nr:hypothetical protein [Deltaproteobacteria bacterium]
MAATLLVVAALVAGAAPGAEAPRQASGTIAIIAVGPDPLVVGSMQGAVRTRLRELMPNLSALSPSEVAVALGAPSPVAGPPRGEHKEAHTLLEQAKEA